MKKYHKSAEQIKHEREVEMKRSNYPDDGTCWCETCEEWSMTEKGSIYHCEECDNWRYSSS